MKKDERQPKVYAVHFPESGIIKVGYLDENWPARYANRQAKAFGITQEQGRSIWEAPGDARHEAFIQAHLSFIFSSARPQGSRVCEWFYTGRVDHDAILQLLDDIYGRISTVSQTLVM